MTTAKTKKDAVGKALYLEFRKDQYTYQVILTPHAVSLEKELIYPTFVRRRISVWHPRRNWNIDKLKVDNALSRDANGNIEQFASDISVQSVIDEIYQKFGRNFENLLAQGWNLYQKPISVEVSYEDLDLLKDGKMSNNLYRRIERSRKAFDWTESLFNEEVVV